MIFQYQSPKRSVVFIAGKQQRAQAESLEFVDNTGGDFDPSDVEYVTEADEAAGRFGFWPQPSE